MRSSILLTALSILAFNSCEKRVAAPTPAEPKAVEVPESSDPKLSLIRVNSTRQQWNPGQPWEKQPPRKRRSLAAVVGDSQVITTAEMVADATMIELESIDGKKLAQGKVVAVDYEANLALIGLADSETESTLFEGMLPLEIAEPFGLGDLVEAIQVEENGTLLVTRGPVQSIDVVANFLARH